MFSRLADMKEIHGKRSVLYILVVFQLLFSGVFCYAPRAEASSVFSGEGTAEKPYLLYDADDLIMLSRSVNEEGKKYYDQYFALANDIDMSGIEFSPIGIFGSDHYFFGVFDGNGYAIKKIVIDVPNSNNGLFGMLGGTVANLVMDGGSVSGAYCGVISSHAAASQAQIMNCETKNVTVNALRAGGVVDNFAGSVINCVSVNCALYGMDTHGAISSFAILGGSYGNYYSANENNSSACEIIAEGSESIDFNSTDLDIVTDKLNTNYRYYDKYSTPFLGICNIWTSSEEEMIKISEIKQEEIFLSSLSKLSGDGSINDPYLISNAEELSIFRNAVNCGHDFYGEYVRQTADIDLSEEIWTPIGQFGTGKYFYGVYDGNGHTIQNLTTVTTGNNGFFGVLGGSVVNLGIESGLIRGKCCGGIVSHADSSSAMVVNCYNKADVVANRAGGIADNFAGSIIGCWSECNLEGELTGGIVSYHAQNISFCKTSYKELIPEDKNTGTVVDSEDNAVLSGIEVQKTAEDLYYNLPKTKELSGLTVNFYPVTSENDQLLFSEKPYVFDLRVWIKDNTVLFILLIVFIVIFLLLLFRIGPKEFYADDRKWWKRFVLLMAPVFLFFYIFLVHSPIEFFIVNNSEFAFTFGDFAYNFIALAVLCSVVISGLFALLKGKISDIAACLILGLDLCMYIQLNFMNRSLGLLDGTVKALNTASSCINMAIWVVLLFLPLVLLFVCRRFRRFRRKAIVFVCGTLCLMQIPSLITLVVQSPESAFERKTSEYAMSGEDQFKVSSDNNIIILIIDTYCNTYLDEFFTVYPEVKEVVKDFTYYNNADCHYEGSVFSINYIASGTEWDPSLSINKWCTTAWNNEKNNLFYSRLKEKGYIFNLYSGELGNLSDDAKRDAMGKVANLVEVECDYQINNGMLLNSFVNTSLYRVAPLILKENYENTAAQFGSAYTVRRNNKDLDLDIQQSNADFYNELVRHGLETDGSSKYYILQHLQGVHGPYTVNENCQSVTEATLLETERGCWRYVEEYLNQLKELGVYDNSTIMITADHGMHNDYYNAQPIFFIKNANETHNEYYETNAPISFTDIMPTVMYLAGAEYADFGTTIYEHTEDEQRERTLYIRMYDEELPDVPKRDSPTKSQLNCFYKYVYTGNIKDLQELGETGPTERILWTDAFY